MECSMDAFIMECGYGTLVMSEIPFSLKFSYIDRVPYFQSQLEILFCHLMQIWQLFIIIRRSRREKTILTFCTIIIKKDILSPFRPQSCVCVHVHVGACISLTLIDHTPSHPTSTMHRRHAPMPCTVRLAHHPDAWVNTTSTIPIRTTWYCCCIF